MMFNRKKCCLLLIWGFNMCLMPQTVSATDPGTPTDNSSQTTYDALVSKAISHYSAREYQLAIDAFKNAYKIQSEPELVYNIARSYERMTQTEEALKWYQKFLDMPGTTGELRTRALNNMSALRAELAARNAAKDTETSTNQSARSDSDSQELSDSEEGEGRNGAASSDNNAASEGPAAAAPSKKAGRSLRIAGWLTTGVGTAFLATGGTFGILAIKSNRQFEDANDDPKRVDYRDDLKRNALLSDIFLAGGAVVTSVGVSLLIIHAIKNRRAANARSKYQLSPLACNDASRCLAPQTPRVMPAFLAANGVFAGGFITRF